MVIEYQFSTFETPMGYVGILGSENGLKLITLPQSSEKEAENLLFSDSLTTIASGGLFKDLIQRLKRYYEGKPVKFPVKLDLSGVTPFQRLVWLATGLIPYGETRSYGWVAGKIGKPNAARAVGQALHCNPLPIIVPCHRVVGSNGEMVGFGSGIDLKRSLLELERQSG